MGGALSRPPPGSPSGRRVAELIMDMARLSSCDGPCRPPYAGLGTEGLARAGRCGQLSRPLVGCASRRCDACISSHLGRLDFVGLAPLSSSRAVAAGAARAQIPNDAPAVPSVVSALRSYSNISGASEQVLRAVHLLHSGEVPARLPAKGAIQASGDETEVRPADPLLRPLCQLVQAFKDHAAWRCMSP